MIDTFAHVVWVLGLFLAVPLAAAQADGVAKPVQIHVDAARTLGPYHAIWNYFGADEPNYTYAPNGRKLLSELSAIDPATPVYFRPHNLLTTGDGSASLKWGSTNVYSERPDGTPVYDWTITDRLFDNLQATHVRPFVEIGFMPEALSPHPEPYRHSFAKAGDDVFTGWSYPPKDYGKWRALIVAWVSHLRQRYGAATDTWQFEVWNEPDIPYFHGTPQEYLKLYDITTGAVREVLPHGIVGGPGATGSGDNKQFMQIFLEHCAHGINADSGKTGAPLDFISFHPKGSPRFIAATSTEAAHVRMNLGRQLQLTDKGFENIASFPEFQSTPIILSETDPEGCAACKGPQNGYRNGTLYGVSVAEMLARSAELAVLRGVNLKGAITWAFEFEDQDYFAGFRQLATNGIDLPVLNVFRIFGKVSGERISLTSTGTVPVGDIERAGVTGSPDVGGFATRGSHSLDIVLWNYHDDDLPVAAADLAINVAHVPAGSIHMTQYRVDDTHSNAYTAWLKLGSPQQPTAEQLSRLREASGLQRFEEKALEAGASRSVTLSTRLPRQGVALYHLSW